MRAFSVQDDAVLRIHPPVAVIGLVRVHFPAPIQLGFIVAPSCMSLIFVQ